MSDKLRGTPSVNGMPRPRDPGGYIPFTTGFPRGIVSWDYRVFDAERFVGIGPDRHIEPAPDALRDEFADD